MIDGFTLLPWQARALETPLSCDLVCGGSRGSGKTDCGLALVLQYITLFPEGRVLFLRRTFPGLQDVATRTQQLFSAADGSAKYSSQSHVWRFGSGATCELGILDSESDLNRYQGRNYHLVVVDEAGSFAEYRWIETLRACLRAPVGQPTRMVLLANAAGAGHSWLLRRYISRGTPWIPFVDSVSGRETIVIPSTFHQNQHIDRLEYARQLKAACAGDAELYKAWADNNWHVARGSFFGSVLEESRVMVEPWPTLPTYSSSVEKLRPHEVRQLRSTRQSLGLGNSLPKWRYFISMDYGCSAPTIVYLFAESPGAEAHGKWYPRGSLIAVSELAFVPDHDDLNRGSGFTVPRQAEEIKTFCASYGVDPSGVCDDACFSNHGSESGSIAQEFSRAGVHLSPARKGGRVARWETMRRMLQSAGQADQPALYVSRACWYFWATAPFIARSPRNPDDVSSTGPDHGCDSVSYGLQHAVEFQPFIGVAPFRFGR